MDTIEVGQKIFQTFVLRLLNQHFAITDDVIERRPQLVLEIERGLCFRAMFVPVCGIRPRSEGAHDAAFFCRSVSILLSSRAISTGLVSKSSQPASMHFSRSP